MKTLLPLLTALLALPAFGAEYSLVKFWASMPAGEKQIGNMHGDIAVSSKNEVYVSVQGGPKAGVQVYDNKGDYLRNVPGSPNDLHGFVIRKTETGEHLYGPRLGGQNILKLALDGKVVLDIKPDADGGLADARGGRVSVPRGHADRVRPSRR